MHDEIAAEQSNQQQALVVVAATTSGTERTAGSHRPVENRISNRGK